MSQKVSFLGGLLALFIGCVVTVLMAEGVVRVVNPHWRDFYSGNFIEAHSVPEQGVVAIGKPGFSGYFAQNNGDFRVKIDINAFGLRNAEPIEKAHNRTWIIGDSMAFGWGVEHNEMYSSVASARSGMPTYNVASPGTNICGYQALTARMPKSVRPKAIVMGLILENDLRVYDCKENKKVKKAQSSSGFVRFLDVKHYLTGKSALYNFFTVSLKRVDVIVTILQKLGIVAGDHSYKMTFNYTDWAKILETSIVEMRHLRAMLPADVPFAVLIAPSRFEIRDSDAKYTKVRQDVAAALRDSGIDVLDPIDAFKTIGFERLHFAHDGHWSPIGHKIAGQLIAEWMIANVPAGSQ